ILELGNGSSGGVLDGIAYGNNSGQLAIDAHHNRRGAGFFGGREGIGKLAKLSVACAADGYQRAFYGAGYSDPSLRLKIGNGQDVISMLDDGLCNRVFRTRFYCRGVVDELV